MSHEQNLTELTRKISETHALIRQCKAQEGAITEGATARLAQVNARLAQLKVNVVTNEAAADEYLALTKEKGALLRSLSMQR